LKQTYISLVTYNTKEKDILKVIQSILISKIDWKLIIVDNSPNNDIQFLVEKYKNIEYIHNPSNPGFGKAHNIALTKSIKEGAEYHFIVNPDIYFDGDVISAMINYMKSDALIGMMMPQILNLDGSIQNLPKLLPSPLSILLRKIKKPASLYQKFIDEYELRNVPTDMIYDAPILSGCFTLLNLEAIKKIGLYDDTYFMYFEDWDLSRRIHLHYKTVYFPLVSVYHGYDSGANKSSRLFKIFVNSAISYFNKWGWFFDSGRKAINKRALSQFK
jgi:GT2 family glycosyltransferase